MLLCRQQLISTYDSRRKDILVLGKDPIDGTTIATERVCIF